MKVNEFMSTSIVSVEMDDWLSVVKDIFDHANFHHLLVVEKGTLKGVISDRDLLRSMSPYLGTRAESTRDLATLNKRVHQIMTRKPVVIFPDADIYEAVDIFNTLSVSCLPVVDDNNVPVGIISWRDIIRVMGQLRPSGL